MQGREREIDTLSVRRPQPHTTNLKTKRREGENSWRHKRREQLGQQKGTGPALETRQSHTIKYGVYQIIPERDWEGNKSPTVLRGSAAGRRKSIPMCDQSIACNPDWHIRHRLIPHHTAEQYSKTGKTKPQKHLPMSNLSWNTRQDFLKIPSLWEAALETERRCFSKVNLESNVTPKITGHQTPSVQFRQ